MNTGLVAAVAGAVGFVFGAVAMLTGIIAYGYQSMAKAEDQSRHQS